LRTKGSVSFKPIRAKTSFSPSIVANQGFDDLTEGQQVDIPVEQGQFSKGKGPRAASVTPL